MKARTIARTIAVTLMGLGVLVATADGFAQSYAGLYGWAIEHGLSNWKADSFPLLVDTFVGVGELGLFLLAIDGHRLRAAAMPWLDLLVPGLVAASGWGASLVFNVGHVRHDFPTQATAAVPPLASMVGLLVLLRTLHRYVTQLDEAPATPDHFPGAAKVIACHDAAEQAGALDDEEFGEIPAGLLAWFTGDERPVPAVPGGVPDARTRAAQVFADEVRRGDVPGIRAIKRRLRVGQEKAAEVRAYLADLAGQPDGPLDASSLVSSDMGR